MKSNKVCGVFDECISICITNNLYQQNFLYPLLVISKMNDTIIVSKIVIDRLFDS